MRAAAKGIGKAGGYAIQGRAESFVRQINGSYSNVVGLPLFHTVQMLRDAATDFMLVSLPPLFEHRQ